MSGDDLLFIGQLVSMARTAQRVISGASRIDLDRDEKLQLALVKALQVMGEAAWRTSPETQSAHPAIPWKKMAGFRHRAVHDYFSISFDTVWRIASQELQPVIDELGPLLPTAPKTPPQF